MAATRRIHVGSRRAAWALAVAVLLLAAGALIRDRVRPRRLAEVEHHWLYRSGRLSPVQVRYARDVLGVEVIVDLTSPNEGRDAEAAAARALGTRWLNFPLNGDGTGSVENYVGAVAAIAAAHREKQRVLLHCHAGIRRTGGVLAAYLVLVEGAPLAAVIDELARFSPDPVRDSVPLAHVESHLSEISGALAARGLPLPEGALDRMALLRDLVGSRRLAARALPSPRG